jgi:hypothetical protein
MAGNMESPEAKQPENTRPTADLTSVGFTLDDQREVANRIAQSRTDNVNALHLDNNDGGERSARRIEQPHNWYMNTKTSYGLPSESAVTGSNLDQTLKAGWRKLG